MRRWLKVGVCAFVVISVNPVPAISAAPEGDIAAGELLAIRACKTCHGGEGRAPSREPEVPTPHLAAQRESYLVKQLKDFRNGVRIDPTMSALAKTLSDQDIKNLAAFYASRRRID